MLERLAEKRILVLGDFFLDKYLLINPTRNERSLETGLIAYQVEEVSCSPGAAGTVANNLASLGVGQVITVGIIGDDGEGYQLTNELAARGINTEHLLVDSRRKTPTYIKPMLCQADGNSEMNRLDIKNFDPTPRELTSLIEEKMERLASDVDGIVVLDQVTEADCGVVTQHLRGKLTELAKLYPHLPIIVDSRAHIGSFSNVIIKPNAREAMAAVGDRKEETEVSLSEALVAGRSLRHKTKRSVYLTLGETGQLFFGETGVWLVPTLRIPGPVDTVGAGDSTTAGIISGLVLGMSGLDAAVLGNAVASVTVEQIGTTGTASPCQVEERLRLFADADIGPKKLV